MVSLRHGVFTISGLRSWYDRRVALLYLDELYKIALCYDVLMVPIKPDPNGPRCPYCTHFMQFWCGLDKDYKVKFIPEKWKNGCNKFDYNPGVYF